MTTPTKPCSQGDGQARVTVSSPTEGTREPRVSVEQGAGRNNSHSPCSHLTLSGGSTGWVWLWPKCNEKTKGPPQRTQPQRGNGQVNISLGASLCGHQSRADGPKEVTEEGASPSAWVVSRGCPQGKRSRVIALTLTRHPKTLLPQPNLPAPPGHTQTWYEEAPWVSSSDWS